MNKQDFIDRLRMALNGRVSPGLVMDNVNYYEDYINTEIRKGRTEEEVLESLGDPRLIARTIIQTNGGDNRSGYRNTVYGNGEYREAAGSTVHHSYNGDGNGEYGTHRSKMADVLAKLLDYSGDPCGGIGDQRGIFSTILPGTGIDPDSGSTVFGKTVSRLAELVTIQSR